MGACSFLNPRGGSYRDGYRGGGSHFHFSQTPWLMPCSATVLDGAAKELAPV
jgi:hypothetical protein